MHKLLKKYRRINYMQFTSKRVDAAPQLAPQYWSPYTEWGSVQQGVGYLAAHWKSKHIVDVTMLFTLWCFAFRVKRTVLFSGGIHFLQTGERWRRMYERHWCSIWKKNPWPCLLKTLNRSLFWEQWVPSEKVSVLPLGIRSTSLTLLTQNTFPLGQGIIYFSPPNRTDDSKKAELFLGGRTSFLTI